MRIVYSFPHPSDTLAGERAGHVVRANSLLRALEDLGHEVVRVEGAGLPSTSLAVGTYRRAVDGLLPPRVAASIRDSGRLVHSRQFARRLLQVVEERPADVILETEVVFATAGARASRRTSVPLVLDDVSPAWESATHYGLALTAPARRARCASLGQAQLVVAVNELVRGDLLEEGVVPDKLVVVENGVDDAFFSASAHRCEQRRALGIGDRELVIGFVGSFQPFHGVDLLVRAFAARGAAPGARLLLVGAGDGLSATRALVDELGLTEQTVFAGRVPHRDVAPILGAIDVAVLPETSGYTNPMKLYEYLAAARAIVAPRRPGVSAILTDERDALLFEPGDADALASALGRLAGDPGLRSALGRNAVARAEGQTWHDRADRLVAAIAERAGT
ncbi:MAG TPA: glycosyltransferase [Acidimicrobiia bacterium]|nr:glycosyltransferase [Acidimicrobiia bacterium]